MGAPIGGDCGCRARQLAVVFAPRSAPINAAKIQLDILDPSRRRGILLIGPIFSIVVPRYSPAPLSRPSGNEMIQCDRYPDSCFC